MGLLDKLVDDVLGDPFGSYHQAHAAQGAAQVSKRYREEAIQEQQRQFDKLQSILAPYVDASKYAMYGMPEGGLTEQQMYGTKNPYAQEVSGMSQDQISMERQRVARDGGDPQYAAALDAARVGEDPTWAGSEYSDELVDPGGLFGMAGAGEDVTPILEQFAQTGGDALTAQRGLTGLDGPEAQASAIEALKGTPEYDMLVGDAEEALLQNASATGGVRGGNTQSALMEVRPDILVDMINRKYAQYGGLAGAGGEVASSMFSNAGNIYNSIMGTGANAASQTGGAATDLGDDVAGLTTEMGDIEAGGIMDAASSAGSGLTDLMTFAEGAMDMMGGRGIGDVAKNFGRMGGDLKNLISKLGLKF
jgi:hypothetical protein